MSRKTGAGIQPRGPHPLLGRGLKHGSPARRLMIKKKLSSFLCLIFVTFLLLALFALPQNVHAQDSRYRNLPEGAEVRLGKGFITDIKFSPDGTQFAVVSSIGIWLYDARTYEEIALLTGHTGWVQAVAFSPDSMTLASVSLDRTVRIWDAKTGQYRTTLYGHENFVYSVAFSPDGKTIASASSNEIRLWNANTGRQENVLARHARWTYALAFSPDGKILASGDSEGDIQLWDPSAGKLMQTLETNLGFLYGLVFSPDGATLAASGSGTTILLWDVGTGRQLSTLMFGESTRGIPALALSSDGTILASGHRDNKVRLWDARTGRLNATLEGHTSDIRALAFSPSGTTLVSASEDSVLHFWDTRTKEFQTPLTGSIALHSPQTEKRSQVQVQMRFVYGMQTPVDRKTSWQDMQGGHTPWRFHQMERSSPVETRKATSNSGIHPRVN